MARTTNDKIKMWAVQFSKDGENFITAQKFSDKAMAESVMKAFAGYGGAFGHPYWRVRQADQSSKDFHAVISDD